MCIVLYLDVIVFICRNMQIVFAEVESLCSACGMVVE